MMVCDPIERAELEFFEIFNNLDTNHADWKAKIDAIGDIVREEKDSFLIQFLDNGFPELCGPLHAISLNDPR